MRVTRPARFEASFWSALPGLLTVMLALLYLSFNHMPGLSQFLPLLPVLSIFYWGLHAPREMPYLLVFILGLPLDAVMGLPLGLTSLLNVLLLAFVQMQRKYILKEGFVIQWGYFAVLLAAIDALGWIILSLFYGSAQPLLALMLQWMLTLCFYPAFHAGFSRLQDYIQSRRWRLMHRR